VFVRQDAPCQCLTALKSADVESVCLLYRQPRMPHVLSHVAVGAIYYPPSADDRTVITHILNSLDNISCDHPQSGIVLMGDFNQLRDSSLLSYPLKQVVKSPTRNAAILDKIYTNLQDWYERPVVLPNVGRSNHRAVAMSATFNNKWERG